MTGTIGPLIDRSPADARAGSSRPAPWTRISRWVENDRRTQKHVRGGALPYASEWRRRSGEVDSLVNPTRPPCPADHGLTDSLPVAVSRRGCIDGTVCQQSDSHARAADCQGCRERMSHANIATTRLYDRRRTQPIASLLAWTNSPPTPKVGCVRLLPRRLCAKRACSHEDAGSDKYAKHSAQLLSLSLVLDQTRGLDHGF